MPGVARKDPGHVVMDGTLRNIRNTLGDGALIETDPRDRQLWDMMSTVRTTQTFNPHHIFDEHANHLDHVIDVQTPMNWLKARCQVFGILSSQDSLSLSQEPVIWLSWVM